MKRIKVKGFTLIELLVVMFIIFTLMGLGVGAYGKYYENAKINTVKQELSSWMADINQYIEDYGKPAFSASEKQITSQSKYLAYIYKGSPDADISGIEITDAYDFEAGSFLGLFQKYIAESLCLQEHGDAVFADKSNHYVVLTTRVKRDPWGNRYFFYINTVSGVVIVLSSGMDGVNNIGQYEAGNYGDDLVLVIEPK